MNNPDPVMVYCTECGGEQVIVDAACFWNYEDQLWELTRKGAGKTWCDGCMDSTELVAIPDSLDREVTSGLEGSY